MALLMSFSACQAQFNETSDFVRVDFEFRIITLLAPAEGLGGPLGPLPSGDNLF